MTPGLLNAFKERDKMCKLVKRSPYNVRLKREFDKFKFKHFSDG